MGKSSNRGFTLIELLTAVALIFVLVALAVPSLVNQAYAIRLRYSATDVSGLLQRARMEAVRKNTFYSVQSVAGSPVLEEVFDKNGNQVTTIPPAVMANSINVFFGPGSGAPNEGTLLTTLNFTAATSVQGLPSFNSRGLPCIPVGGVSCPFTTGQGFVFFVSGPNSAGGTGWAAVAVTPSGRCQVWTYDGANWNQQ